MGKWKQAFVDLSLYLIASGFVLMTVTGTVFKTGAILTILGFIVQVTALVIPDKDDEK